MVSEKVKLLHYRGDQDLTVWLRGVSEDPRIFPLWTPGLTTCFLDYPEIGSPTLGVVLARQIMLLLIKPGRLWFCGISPAELCRWTDADPAWFDDSIGGTT